MSNKIFVLSFLAIIFTNALQGKVIQPDGNVPSRLDDIACTTCIDAADYVHSNPQQPIEQVYAAMIIDCKRYAQYYLTCQETLDMYLNQIYQQAHNPLLTSLSVCTSIQLCHSKHPDMEINSY